MEGVGYWLIIAALYFLSSLMKKRKQQAARRELDQEDSVPDSEQKQTLFQSDYFQDMFGDIKNMVERSGLELGQESDEFIISDENDSIEYEQEILDQDTEVETIESDKTEFVDKLKQVSELLIIDREGIAITHYHLSSILKDRQNLKQVIMLKEILDKPRAMRRAIR